MKNVTPLIYYPLKVLIIDDDLDMLHSMRDTLSPKFGITVTSSIPESIHILEHESISKNSLLQDVTDNNEINIVDDVNQLSTLKLTINTIITIAEDLSKYQKYGILISDYDMPELNGIELCKKFILSPVKKILLTGKYDLTNAIVAFNNKIIDCYIRKGQENTTQEIEFYVKQLTYDYFNELSSEIINAISNNQLKFIKDPEFALLLNATINKLDITEYYIINRYGAYLLINSNKRFVFISYTQKNLDEFCDMYKDDVKFQEDVSAIKSGNYIPFFGVKTDPLEANSSLDWNSYLYRANRTGNYYWTVIDLTSLEKNFER